MKLELFVALRYLREKRKRTMVSVISILAVAGIAAGVMALVVALSLSTGFREDVQAKILGATPAVNLFHADTTPIVDHDALLEKISDNPGVTASAPAILKQVILSSARANQGAALKGVYPEREAAVSNFFSRIIEENPRVLDAPPRYVPALMEDAQTGQIEQIYQTYEEEYDDDYAPLPLDNILIGNEMARTLGVAAGDTIKILNPMGRLTPLGMTISEKTVRVAGVFESGLWDIDSNWAYVNIETARRVFSFPENSVLLLQFNIKNLDRAAEVADSLREKAGPDFAATTWIDLNRPLFSALKLEKIALFITIGLIVFVASLNILTTLIMTVLEKQGSIAVFMAMGATAATIRRVFMYQGLILGIAGTVIGDILGVSISWFLNRYQIIKLEAEVYSIPYVPFHVHASDVLLISATAILISYLATIYPSRGAAKLNPVETLRYE
ncbi:MAG: ABC transporter permease [Acidobacteriota bacterium]|jgi:lipoprotein-releasing system permease protein|nr:ABC transporter permease [Acidobacteriota bacterium]